MIVVPMSVGLAWLFTNGILAVRMGGLVIELDKTVTDPARRESASSMGGYQLARLSLSKDDTIKQPKVDVNQG